MIVNKSDTQNQGVPLTLFPSFSVLEVYVYRVMSLGTVLIDI